MRRFPSWLWIGFLTLLVVWGSGGSGGFSQERPGGLAEGGHRSSYELLSQAPFNQDEYFPLAQSVDPGRYRSVAEWVGRLILPKPGASMIDDSRLTAVAALDGSPSAPDSEDPVAFADWVWFEVQQAPSPFTAWIGSRLRLTWSPDPEVQAYVQTVTQPVRFTSETHQSQHQGIIHPERLQRYSQVGPLQSLAGAWPEDAVTVALADPLIQLGVAQKIEAEPILRIRQDPLLVSGRYQGVVSHLDPAEPITIKVRDGIESGQSGKERDSDYQLQPFQVQHFDVQSGTFTGPTEQIHIPIQPPDRAGILPFSTDQLSQSPAGDQGWMIYGAPNAEGIFTVQALQPRHLVDLNPDEVRLDQTTGLRWIHQESWQDPSKRQGSVRTVLLAPGATTKTAALEQWQEGDHALVIHLFGGIGGEKAESQSLPGTVTGHFSYGWATVVRNPLTQALKFDITYQQVYAHNTNGIIAGSQNWSSYMGDLQRGWLGTRPVMDVVIKWDPVTRDYDFDGEVISPMRALQYQLRIMMARYRVGDGTGAALVTPALSCVQDSNQALYIAIQQVTQQVQGSPTLQAWLRQHPDHPQTQRFEQLVDFVHALSQELVPTGVVRSDWVQNAEQVSGIQLGEATDLAFWPAPLFQRDSQLSTALLSWRTLLPQPAQSRLASLFLSHGASLWILQTFQVGGTNDQILPLAPTGLLGQWPLGSQLLARLSAGGLRIPSGSDWLLALVGFGGYGAIALGIGLKIGFLHWDPLKFQALKSQLGLLGILRVLGTTAVAPAWLEEMGFRVLLVPHPSEWIPVEIRWLWIGASLVLFGLYHPLLATTVYPRANPTFFNPYFLGLAIGLGMVCTGVYLQTGSVWTVASLHWGVVVIWLLGLGGWERLTKNAS